MRAQRERFEAALIAGDFQAALAIAREVAPRGLPVLYEDLITRALIDIGQGWESGRLSVADEHVATAVAHAVVASLYPLFPWPADGHRAIITCAPGEQHELGARMTADLLTWDGWNVKFVGADVPLQAVVDLVVRDRPALLGISLALPERVASVRDLIARVRRDVPGVRILVGGRVVARGTLTAAELGADAVAPSAASAVDVARTWKP